MSTPHGPIIGLGESRTLQAKMPFLCLSGGRPAVIGDEQRDSRRTAPSVSPFVTTVAPALRPPLDSSPTQSASASIRDSAAYSPNRCRKAPSVTAGESSCRKLCKHGCRKRGGSECKRRGPGQSSRQDARDGPRSPASASFSPPTARPAAVSRISDQTRIGREDSANAPTRSRNPSRRPAQKAQASTRRRMRSRRPKQAPGGGPSSGRTRRFLLGRSGEGIETAG
jgi:hypothetical protein